MKRSLLWILLFLHPILIFSSAHSQPAGTVLHDKLNKTVTMTDGRKTLQLRLNYHGQCCLDRVIVRGRETLSTHCSVHSTVSVEGIPYSTEDLTQEPTISIKGTRVNVTGISLDGRGLKLTEQWTFAVNSDNIEWRIDRTYGSSATCETAFAPSWDFPDTSTWTGAMLGTGGVAWFKMFDSAHATYGVHTGKVTFWKKGSPTCLRIAASSTPGSHVAATFTRQPNGRMGLGFQIDTKEPLLKHDPEFHRRRFLSSREDVWQPITVTPTTVSVHYALSAPDFEQEYGRGTCTHFSGELIGDLARTIARMGVIDTHLHGGNSWRTPYGPICLHEQYIAQLGLLIDDEDYFESYQSTLNSYRDHAILPDGRVKARWAYTCEDAMPGTCDSLGFYEAQWGYLLDSNPDYVINVSELFDYTGSLEWVRGHKSSCERALDYMTARDSDNDGLVEMKTDNHTEERGSDWIDIIWAAHENAFVNAEMYYALTLWADIETLLGDPQRAAYYRLFADRLKTSYNRTTRDGGFWDPDSQWYVHWRDKDGSVHGNNLVTFVNFMAIAYGICDDAGRRDGILRKIETEMQKEDLFWWPICMFTYAAGEGLSWQFPFPNYENGDIFLSSGELGVRAYRQFDPGIPVRYIRKVLEKYEKDGLAFQRYSRKTQEGLGDDILAGNAFPLVGLYRDIYGIQPKYNRLYFEPHATPPLDGTQLVYHLRRKVYALEIGTARKSVSVDNFTIADTGPFGINTDRNTVQYFAGESAAPSIIVARSGGDPFTITIRKWVQAGIGPRSWLESCSNPRTVSDHLLRGLGPGKKYTVLIDGRIDRTVLCDASGQIAFRYTHGYGAPHTFDITEE